MLFVLFCFSVAEGFSLSLQTLKSSPSARTRTSLLLVPLQHDAAITTTNSFPQELVDGAHNRFNQDVEDPRNFGVSIDLYRGVKPLDSTNIIVATQPSVRISNSETTTKDSAAEDAGKWFFVLYVVVSLAAGFKDFGSRFQQWLQGKEE